MILRKALVCVGLVTCSVFACLITDSQAAPYPERLALKVEFDENEDGKQSTEERARARISAKEARSKSDPLWLRKTSAPLPPKPVVDAAAAEHFNDQKHYSINAVRTVFIEFPGSDWEAELRDFYLTDVEIPATVTHRRKDTTKRWRQICGASIDPGGAGRTSATAGTRPG